MDLNQLVNTSIQCVKLIMIGTIGIVLLYSVVQMFLS